MIDQQLQPQAGVSDVISEDSAAGKEELEYSPEIAAMILEAAAGDLEEIDIDAHIDYLSGLLEACIKAEAAHAEKKRH